MSKVTLSPVRYYDITDIYTASVDNRPLRDISSNVSLLNDAIQAMGFYQEIYASQDVEPPGGFFPFTCVAVSKTNRLIPIDISVSPLIVDYATLPLYLIIESLGASLYKCLSFASVVSLLSTNNGFLAESIGKALKVGPGGSLVDEIYFDLYYGSLKYQQLLVGKILTQSTFSFGGNQVSTLGDNRFLPKNRNDATTGLITRQIDLQDSHTAFSSIILGDSVRFSGSQSMYTSYINSLGSSTISNTSSKSPVYFSYDILKLTSTGALSSDNINLLNEVHFSSVQIGPTLEGVEFLTAGVNVDSLLKYTNSYTLHAPNLSVALSETNQNLNTSLTFTDPNLSSVNIPIVELGISPLRLQSTLLIDPEILTYLSVNATPGTSFGNFQATSASSSLGGGYLGLFKYGIDPGTIDGGPIPLFDSNGPTDFIFGNDLILYAKKPTDNTALGAATLHLISDGYVVLGAPNGTFYKMMNQLVVNDSTLAYELTNRGYVDASLLSLTDISNKKIPLSGSTIDIPVTGPLYFDTTSAINGQSPDVNFLFKNVTSSQFRSDTRFEYLTYSGGGFQTIRGLTLPDGAGTHPNDLTTRAYVTAAITALSGAALTGYVTLSGAAQTISSSKTFSGAITIATGGSLLIQSNEIVLPILSTLSILDNDTIPALVKVRAASPDAFAGDSDVLVTKNYFETNVATPVTTAIGSAPIYATWSKHSVGIANITNLFAGFTSWMCLTSAITEDHSLGFLSVFNTNSDGTLTYTGAPALFMICGQDSRTSENGPDLGGGVWRAQNTILVKRSGGTIVQYAHNVHQDDTDGNSVNSLVGASTSSIVVMNSGDTLGVLSEWAQWGSASLMLLRYI